MRSVSGVFWEVPVVSLVLLIDFLNYFTIILTGMWRGKGYYLDTSILSNFPTTIYLVFKFIGLIWFLLFLEKCKTNPTSKNRVLLRRSLFIYVIINVIVLFYNLGQEN